MDAPRLTKVTIEGLFGNRDYDIDFVGGAPVILTGANGTGKSSILRLVNAVSKGDALTLFRAPVNSLHLQFSDGRIFGLKRAPNGDVHLQYADRRGIIKGASQLTDLPPMALRLLEEFNFDPVAALDAFRESLFINELAFDDYQASRQALSTLVDEPRSFVTTPPVLTQVADDFEVLFVTDQRLIKAEPERNTPNRYRPSSRRVKASRLSVEAVSFDLRRRLRDADVKYAFESQEQDRKFPQLVLQALGSEQKTTAEELQELISRVEEQRDSLRSVGLLPKAAGYDPRLESGRMTDPSVRTVMKEFMQLNLLKFQTLADLGRRLTAYLDFMNRRLSPKSLQLTRELGIRVATANAAELTPSALSSGEQQLAVIAHEILFRTTPGTLVILDEPEISLHIAWQSRLLEDLLDIGAIADVSFLMATHSPVIVASGAQYEESLDDAAV